MEMAKSFREILKSKLVERMERNPKYSLRAFARDLKLHPARLSDVLNGKKGLSREAAEAISAFLDLSKEEQIYFCDLVESDCSRSAALRRMARLRLDEHEKAFKEKKSLTLDAFRLISDWYHLTITQLMKLPAYRDDPQWIASQLDLPVLVVQDALERLERLELIRRVNGRYVACDDTVLSTDGVPSEAIKKYHEQMLKKATAALYLQDVKDRDFWNFTMPVASKDLPEIRKKIRTFVEKISEEYSVKPDCDRIVNYSSVLFNLTPKLRGQS